MNRHSLLYGNDPAKAEGRSARGQRVFCSNRGQRSGCGRTFSIFVADVLPRHTFTATLLGRLLCQMLTSISIKAAAHSLPMTFPLETIYHLLQRLRRRLPDIRSRLCRQQKAPVTSQSDPLGHTVEHLQQIFPASLCPVIDFQLTFQQPFLG